MQNNVNIERTMKLEEMIKKAKYEAPNAPTLELIEEFEELTQTLAAFHKADGSVKEALSQKLADSHNRLMSQLMRVSASFGMTLPQFNEFLADRENFEVEDSAGISFHEKKVRL